MNPRARDVRNVTIGLVTGAALVLAMGQAAAQNRQQQRAQLDLVHRYQITAGRDAGGNEVLFVLDHHTQKIHRASANIGADGTDVAQLAQIRD
jgi:hypothetical protein